LNLKDCLSSLTLMSGNMAMVNWV